MTPIERAFLAWAFERLGVVVAAVVVGCVLLTLTGVGAHTLYVIAMVR